MMDALNERVVCAENFMDMSKMDKGGLMVKRFFIFQLTTPKRVVQCSITQHPFEGRKMDFDEMKTIEPELARLEHSAFLAGENQAAWTDTAAAMGLLVNSACVCCLGRRGGASRRRACARS